jgi:hypothetical protein
VTTPDQPKAEPTAEELLRKENEELKKKFGASTTENQVLQARLKAQEDARKELTKEPTDSEFRTAFPDWDVLDDSQKADKRRIYNAERSALAARQIAEEIRDERARNTSIQLALSSTPALQGKEQAFTEYVSRPQYKGVPMEVLVDAFLGKQGTAPEPPKPTPRPGLEPGNGGPRTPDKGPKKYTAEEMKTIRETDARRYAEIVKSGMYEADL